MRSDIKQDTALSQTATNEPQQQNQPTLHRSTLNRSVPFTPLCRPLLLKLVPVCDVSSHCCCSILGGCLTTAQRRDCRRASPVRLAGAEVVTSPVSCTADFCWLSTTYPRLPSTAVHHVSRLSLTSSTSILPRLRGVPSSSPAASPTAVLRPTILCYAQLPILLGRRRISLFLCRSAHSSHSRHYCQHSQAIHCTSARLDRGPRAGSDWHRAGSGSVS